MSRLLSSVLAVLFIALASVGCQRKDLMDPHDHHNLVIKAKLDDHALNQLLTIDNDGYSNPGEPKTTTCIFYVKNTQEVAYKGTIKGFEGGVFLEEGIYDMLLYTSDFYKYDANFMRGMNDPLTSEVYTRQYTAEQVRSDMLEMRIENPDPTFGAFYSDILVLQGEENKVIEVDFVQKSFKYYLTIRARGLNNIHTATMHISGMYTSAFLTNEDHRMDEAATQTVDMEIKRYDVNDITGEGELYGEFWSFGPNQRGDILNSITLYFVNGEVITMQLKDLTSQIKTLTKGGEIIVEEKLEIRGPQGGFKPEVGDWNDTNIDLEL